MYKKGLLLTLVLLPVYSALAQLNDFQINAELTGSNQVQKRFFFSENGEKIYYATGSSDIDGEQLFVADISSPDSSVLLNRSLATANRSISFGREASSGNRISFISGFPRLGYIVDTDGSNERFVNTISSIIFQAPEFGSTDDLIFYSEPLPTDSNVHVLYKNDLSNNAGPIRLDTHPTNDNGLDFAFTLAGDAKNIVYLARGGGRLFSVSADGGPPIRLDENGVTGFLPFGEQNYKLSPDGKRVIYRSTNPITGARNLYSISITGQNRVLLDTETRNGESVGQFDITPDSQSVVYFTPTGALNSLKQLYVAPIDGSSPSIQLSGNLGPSGDVFRFFIGPQSQRAVYQASQAIITESAYYSVLLDGSSDATQVSPQTTSLGRPEFSKNGEYLSFSTFTTVSSTQKLYISNLLSGNSREVLNSNGFESVFKYEFSNLSDFLVFNASVDSNSKIELYAQPVASGTPVKISRELTDAELFGRSADGVIDFKVPKSGNHVVYLGTITRPLRPDLFSVDLSGIEIEEESDELCVPLKTKTDKISVICL